MDWNSSILRNSSFVSHPSEFSSSNLLYNFNQFGRFTGLEAKHDDGEAVETSSLMASKIVPASMEMGEHMIQMMSYGSQEKMMKKRLTANQLESLESSFQEEKKLDPDRKMRLARDLGLQPRQVAVWFQNRRARWKNKKLEHLYDALKHDFDLVSKEKQKLQQEVQRLKCMLVEQQGTSTSRKKQVCSGYNTEASCEETTLESTTSSSADRNCNINNSTPSQPIFSRELNKVGGHYHHRLFINNLDVFNTNNNVVSSPSYWGALASL